MKRTAQRLDDAISPWQSIVWGSSVFAGHETCRLNSTGGHWQLEGTAVFTYDANPCQLSYDILCDEDWETISARINGWLGVKRVSIQIESDDNHRWRMNGVAVPGVDGCIDLDLSFSPSTNTIAIRRLRLEVGKKEEITAAWLRFPSFALEPLKQSYYRLQENLYRYESGDGGFVADLSTNSEGFVMDYPGIWKFESFEAGQVTK